MNWFKKHWFTLIVVACLVLNVVTMFHEGFTVQRLNTMMWMICAGCFWEMMQSWRRISKGWERLYYKNKDK